MTPKPKIVVAITAREFVWTGVAHRGYLIRGQMAMQAGEWLVRSLEVIPNEPPADEADPLAASRPVVGLGVTSDLLRSVPIGEIRRQFGAKYLELDRYVDAGQLPEAFRPSPFVIATSKQTGRKHRIDDEFLMVIALLYIEESARGRGVWRRMKARLDSDEQFADSPHTQGPHGADGIPEATIKDWISRSRAAGWLAPGARGRVVAAPGPRLATWRDAQEKDRP